jgi:hypothetical protein
MSDPRPLTVDPMRVSRRTHDLSSRTDSGCTAGNHFVAFGVLGLRT